MADSGSSRKMRNSQRWQTSFKETCAKRRSASDEKETTNAGDKDRRKTYEDARSQSQGQIARPDTRKKQEGGTDPRNPDGRRVHAMLW